MGDSDRPKPDVNATIQLGSIDADQVTFPDSQPHLPRRVTPPPLPPEESAKAQMSLPVQASVTPPKSQGKTIALVGAFVVLLVLAIVGGLKVGALAHSDATAPSASASVAVAPVATPVPTPSASASAAPVHEITIPTIEMR